MRIAGRGVGAYGCARFAGFAPSAPTRPVPQDAAPPRPRLSGGCRPPDSRPAIGLPASSSRPPLRAARPTRRHEPRRGSPSEPPRAGAPRTARSRMERPNTADPTVPETPEGPVTRPLMRYLSERLSPPVPPRPAVPSGSCAPGSPSAGAGRRGAPAVPRPSVPRRPRDAPASCGAGWLCCGTSSSSSMLSLTSPLRRPWPVSSGLPRARVVGFAIPVNGQAKHAIPTHCREGTVKVM